MDAAATSTAVARLKADGSADYEFDLHWDLPGGWGLPGSWDLPVGTAQPGGGYAAVHTGSIAAIIEPGAAGVARVVDRLRGRATVSYDPNCRPALMGSAGEVPVQAHPVTVVDTVGAGDSYTAGLLSALWRRGLLGAGTREALRSIDLDTLGAVMRHAALVSALTVQRAGADSPRTGELPRD